MDNLLKISKEDFKKIWYTGMNNRINPESYKHIMNKMDEIYNALILTIQEENEKMRKNILRDYLGIDEEEQIQKEEKIILNNFNLIGTTSEEDEITISKKNLNQSKIYEITIKTINN